MGFVKVNSSKPGRRAFFSSFQEPLAEAVQDQPPVVLRVLPVVHAVGGPLEAVERERGAPLIGKYKIGGGG